MSFLHILFLISIVFCAIDFVIVFVKRIKAYRSTKQIALLLPSVLYALVLVTLITYAISGSGWPLILVGMPLFVAAFILDDRKKVDSIINIE